MKNIRRLLFSTLAAGFVAGIFNANAEECTAKLDKRAFVTVVGAFSNMRYTTEHQYGYKVELWRSGDCLFGLFLAAEGLQGDTPTGLLENILYNADSGQLSFTARLSMGVTRNEANTAWVPSLTVYKFSGTYNRKMIHGGLRRESSKRSAASPANSELISLTHSPKESKQLITFWQYTKTETSRGPTFANWQKHAEEILAFRGPPLN